MSKLLRLSEHPLSYQWLAQFRKSDDRGHAAQLLNHIKLVSTREFEVSIESAIIQLQKKLNQTIAVFPVTPPNPRAIIGYHPFEGGISTTSSRFVGRRQQYGSEGRVAHVLTGLQRKYTRLNKTSAVECTPTLKQIKSQGIKHIVLVDDICGSGSRLVKFWKEVVPKSIKSLLSLKRCELWIIVYASSSGGRAAVTKAMPGFPIATHLISAHPEISLHSFLTPEIAKLCENYAKLAGAESAAIGYKNSACPVIFEYGCPNNLPVFLWKNAPNWKALFPNRAIPHEFREWFDGAGEERLVEALWRSNQPKLALGLLDALEGSTPLPAEYWTLLTILGLCLRGVSAAALGTKVLMSTLEVNSELAKASSFGLYDIDAAKVTSMGAEFVSRFKDRSRSRAKKELLDVNLEDYYPMQCEGKFQKLGKTDRGNGRTVPMSST
jgi:hypothetical protein